MKTIKKFTALAAFFIFTFSISHAQHPKVLSGKPESLKAIKTWKVEFVYNNPEVQKEGKESDLIARKIKEWNEKEAGKGDKWAKDWEENKNLVYKPKFELLMNKYLEKSGVKVGPNANDKTGHTIIVETTWIYLGYNVGVMKQPAKINTIISFVSDAARDKPLLKVEMIESPGDVYFANPFSEFDRLTESYAKCGKDLAGYLSKSAYK